MGMFDYVKYEAKCFNCGADLSNFQTKDTECRLDLVEPEYCTYEGFYTNCDACNTWNEFITENGKIRLKQKNEIPDYLL